MSALMKTVEEAAILTSMVAGVGWVAKKALKETLYGRSKQQRYELR